MRHELEKRWAQVAAISRPAISFGGQKASAKYDRHGNKRRKPRATAPVDVARLPRREGAEARQEEKRVAYRKDPSRGLDMRQALRVKARRDRAYEKALAWLARHAWDVPLAEREELARVRAEEVL